MPSGFDEKNGSIARFEDLRRHALAGIDDRQFQVAAGFQHWIAAGLVFGKPDLDRTAVGHRVARVDGEIEYRELELIGIDARRRQPFRKFEPQRDARSQRSFQKIDHALDQAPQIHRHRPQILLPRERQQALGQRRATLGALQGAVDQAMQARIVGKPFTQQVEIAHHRHQQIVEIMRNAAGELADGLHLLRLAQLLLGLFARSDFLHQIGGTLLDPLFERRRQFRQRGALGGQLRQQTLAFDFRDLARGDIGGNADQRFDAAVRPANRARPDIDPMLRSVRPDIAVFDAVVLAGLDGLLHHLHAPGAIVGMNRRQQILIRKRFARLAAEKTPGRCLTLRAQTPADAIPARRDGRR